MADPVIINDLGLELPLLMYFLFDDYDHSMDPNTFSATELLRPVKSIVLSRRMVGGVTNVSELSASRMGSAIHSYAERSWDSSETLKLAMSVLEINPERVNLQVNPEPEDLEEGDVPVYVEQRVTKQFGQWTVSGKYDLVFDGEVQDIKSKTAFSYKKKSINDLTMQGSIYRSLNPEKITKSSMAVHYIITNWNSYEAGRDTSYPHKAAFTERYPLMSIAETDQFITSKLEQIDALKESKQIELPPCTPEELWMDESVFKYYKNPQNKTRSTKNFNTSIEAYDFMHQKHNGVGEVVEVKGTPKACNYCRARSICDQAKSYGIN